MGPVYRSTDRNGSGGAIVKVSSLASVLGVPNEYVDYAASTGAIDTLTVGLSKVVAHPGLRVNGVRTGPIDTGITPRVATLVVLSGRQEACGKPEEVARAILWLFRRGFISHRVTVRRYRRTLNQSPNLVDFDQPRF